MKTGPGRIDLEGGIPRVSLLAGPSTTADVRQVLLLHRAQSRLLPAVDGCQVLVLLRALCRDDSGQDLGESAGGGVKRALDCSVAALGLADEFKKELDDENELWDPERQEQLRVIAGLKASRHPTFDSCLASPTTRRLAEVLPAIVATQRAEQDEYLASIHRWKQARLRAMQKEYLANIGHRRRARE